MRPVIQLVQILLILLLVYVSYLSYLNYSEANVSSGAFQYWRQDLSLLPAWSNNQFQKHPIQKPLDFKLSIQKNSLLIEIPAQGRTQQEVIPLSDLQFDIIDGKEVTEVTMLSEKFQIIKLASRFMTIVYNMKNRILCYSKININYDAEQTIYVDESGHLWVLTYPKFKVIIARIFSTTAPGLINRVKYPLKQSVQLVSSISENSQLLIVKLLTFNRDILNLQFNKQSFDLHSKELIRLHSFTYSNQDIQNFVVNFADSVLETETYHEIMDFLFQLSFGKFGYPYSKSNNDTRLSYNSKIRIRDDEADFDFEAYDCEKGLILESNQYNNMSEIISFGEVLVPLRTPAFLSKEHTNQLLPFDEVLNRSKNEQLIPQIDIKLYTIKTKSLEIIKKSNGLYKLLPDSSVHFVEYSNNFLKFYPKENVKKDQYLAVRIARGAILMEDHQIKGAFEQTPVNDPRIKSISLGFADDEVYHEHTTNGVQIGASIYEVHAAHKGLFAKPHKNRLELITSVSGKPVLTHYFSKKDGFEYSTSFIENNEFWVFEHKQNERPLITKYELFVNASSVQTVLSIKRIYRIPANGRITSIQKCIDFFYYLEYKTENNRYGVARVHHALLSNRQALPDGKYSGVFEKMMIIPKIERNTKFVVTSEEEQMMTMEIQLPENVVRDWVKLKLKHQYQILPVRVYSHGSQYYVINIRKLLLQAFDHKILRNRVHFYEIVLLITSGLVGLLVILIALGYSKWKTAKKSADKSGKKEN